jgi:hypothetical protein
LYRGDRDALVPSLERIQRATALILGAVFGDAERASTISIPDAP